MGFFLFVVGVLVALVASIMLLIAAFRESLLWGLGCLIIPFVALIFIITHWEEGKRPLLLSVAGAILILIGSSMMRSGDDEVVFYHRAISAPALA